MSISVHLRFPDASLEVCLQQALNWSVWMEYRLPDILIGYLYFNIQNKLVDYENLHFLKLKFSVSINEKACSHNPQGQTMLMVVTCVCQMYFYMKVASYI